MRPLTYCFYSTYFGYYLFCVLLPLLILLRPTLFNKSSSSKFNLPSCRFTSFLGKTPADQLLLGKPPFFNISRLPYSSKCQALPSKTPLTPTNSPFLNVNPSILLQMLSVHLSFPYKKHPREEDFHEISRQFHKRNFHENI